ncbi:MAG: choice-of-anchor D domain-containing protein [Candidatus Acidiferrales bacterium]
MKKFLMVFVCLLAMLALPAIAKAQLQVPIIVQPAEWTGMAVYPGGTRTNAPVTFGLGIPDAAGIDCPGTQDFPQHEQAPTKLSLYNGATQLNSQFRCMAKWPDGKAEWVLVDAQLPSFMECQPSCTGTAGYDTTITVKQVSSGGGNFPATSMAVQCTGAGAPVSACPDSNHILVNTTAATFLIKEANYNLFDDVQTGSAHLISKSNHGNNDGLILLGPPTTATGIDSVSCVPSANGTTALAGSSGPIPTNYSGPSVCGTPYRSNQDSASTCVIEENGPLRSVVMCQGNMVNGTTAYLQWRTRTHFWYQHSDAKVTVALRNALATNPNVINPSTAYREFQQFEERLTDNLGTTRNYDISTASGNVSGTGFTTGEYAYLFQGHSSEGTWPHWDAGGGNNCQYESDGCVVSYIPRSGTASSRQYSLDGWQINQNSATPSTVGGNNTFPVGWFDLDDGTNGIETGVYQFAMYWPKSLEAQPLPTGATNGNEMRIGVWPNMQDAISGAASPVFGANTIQNPSYSTASDSQPIASYVIGYPQYQIHDTYWNFHSGTQSAAVAQQNFLYFQHYMLARPQSPTYYNSVTDSASGFPALFYNIPDPVAEDQLYINMGACSQAAGECLGDVGMTATQGYPYQGSYGGMKIFRYFGWPTAGGSDGTQFEQRDSFLRNFLQRGCIPSGTSCGSASLTGSTPGRYVFAAHFYRMVAEKTLPRSDGTPTSGASAGFRQYCTPYTVTCQQSEGFSSWGDPHPVNLTSSTSWMNGGMRNWGDAINEMEHSTYWGIFDYYHLSGDEWMKEQLLQGFKDRYENPWVQYNNSQANVAGGNSAAGHGHINAIRAIGHHLSGMAREADFLCSIGDPDCDTKANLTSGSPSIPGSAVGTTTPLESALNILSTAVVIPFISGGYPQGFVEASGGSLNCRQNAGTGVQNCSQGISPIRGFPRAGGSGEDCTIPWNNSNAESLGQTIVDTNGNLEEVTTAGTTGSGSHPAWNTATGGTTSDGTVVWTNQGPATPPCNANNFRAADSFQQGIEAEGIYDAWQELRKIMGPDWHINVGTASGGSPILDGATSLSNVLVSEKNLVDAMGLIGLQMNDGNCVSGGNYTNSGCVYTQSSDYLNAQTSPAPAPGPGCVSTGDCLRTTTAGASACTLGCSGLTEWLGIAGAALTTNSIFNLNGTPWQFFFNAQLNGGQVVQELGSHMMQQAMSYILANGSTSNSTSFSLASSIPALTEVPVTITGCTGTGCTFGANLCTSGSTAGTCTITWSTPAGICTVGINCPPNNAPNGQQYRLKYWYCTTGTLTILGNDCPSGGKTIQRDLGFREDILTAGAVATDGFGTQVGSSAHDPAHNWNLLASIDVPDCGNGTPASGCNSAAVTGTSYTFNMRPNSTYNFYLGAYQTSGCSGVTLSLSSYDFNSSVVGVPSSDSPQTFVLNNCTAAAITSVTPSVSGTNSADFPYAIPGTGGCGSTLAAGTSCNYTDTFTPSIVGAESASLNVTYGGSGGGGTVINAADCTYGSFVTAVGLVGSSGAYTIQMPACGSLSSPIDWTTQGSVSVPGAVKLIVSGAGSGSTFIGDNVTKNGGTTSSLMAFTVTDPGQVYLENMTIVGVATDPSVYNKGHVVFQGQETTNPFRVTGVAFSNQQTTAIETHGWVYGVIDHNTFSGSFKDALECLEDGWGGGTEGYGDGSWAAPTQWGTEAAVFLENNTATNTYSVIAQFSDGAAGSHIVARFNTLNGFYTGNHGTDTSQRTRSGRTQEIYDNTDSIPTGETIDFFNWTRGGSSMVFGNTISVGSGSGYGPTSMVYDFNERDTAAYTPWGQCNGTSVYDQNSLSSGYRCVDQPGSGQSNDLAGAATPPSAPVNNASEPHYVFLNQANSSEFDSISQGSGVNVLPNRDAYVYTSGFTGATGVGSGTFAAMPTTCTVGVGYWATDRGSWNTTLPANTSGQLYKCTATNTWTLFYTPYTYPHPLTTGGGGAMVSSSLSGAGLSPGGVPLTPASHTFANTAVGNDSSDSPVTFTLTNSSSSVVTAISISITGAGASDYFDAPPATTCGTSLPVAASCQIYVSFAPIATGVSAATLSISDSDPGSPQTASLSGTAIPPVINPTPANPVTFGVVVTDPSIPSTVKNENQKQAFSFAASCLSSAGLFRMSREAGNCAAKDFRKITSARDFSHVDLFGFLHQERPGYAPRASAR